MDLNIKHLEYVLEVYRCKSINKASKACFISQPQLSKIVKDIEQELGFEIMTRDRSGLIFNRNGLLFIDSAERIVQEARKIGNIPQLGNDNGSLHIASSPSGLIMQAFLDYRGPVQENMRENSDIFKECGLQEIIKQVVMRESPLGLMVMFRNAVEKYTIITSNYGLSMDLLKEKIPVYVFMSKNHPLSKKDNLRTEDLKKYPFVFDSQVDYDDTLAGALKINHSVNPLYVTNRASRNDAVRSGYYLCHASTVSISTSDSKDFCFRKILDFEDSLSIYLLKDSKRAYTNKEQNFIDFLIKRVK